MNPRLQDQLDVPERNLRRVRLWRRLAFVWLVTTGLEVALILIRIGTGWSSRPLWWLVLLGGFIAAWVFWRRESRRPQNYRALVATIARENPDVRDLLSAAVEQEADAKSGGFGFLQWRVINEALQHPQAILWEEQVARKTASARNRQWLALAAMLLVFSLANHGAVSHWRINLNLSSLVSNEITVTPGNTEVERGTGLVISARFAQPPPEASLVLTWAAGKTQRLPLVRTLTDPVFGSSLLSVADDAVYHIEYSGKQTGDYKIHVFDFPALTRADAALQFPAYTGLTNKTIRDTIRISAVEGTRLDYTLLLNKPVTHARFISRERSLPLALQTNAIATLDNFTLTNNARFSLELIDSAGRTNKTPTEFVFQALPNRPPELKITFPRGDQRVSKLEEMQLQGSARDDLGLVKYGFGIGVAGQSPQFIELGHSTNASELCHFTNQISLEKLGVEVDQLVSYFAWADDFGPDGKVRRTFSDIFFAEVRPFEQIYRADQSGESEGRNQRGNQGQGGNQSPRLAELQKQIVIATWKLQRTETVLPKEDKP